MSKGPLAFRTISEVAETLDVPQHVLRFWETKFSFITPTKRAGGRRFYRPQDVEVLAGVKALLHDQGYTIRGVQKLYAEEGLKALVVAYKGAVAPEVEPVRGSSVQPEPVAETPEGVVFSEARIQALGDETRAQFLEIARNLEIAQALLGRHIGRHSS
ncbi:MerR family transcriptional regulator [Asticcacaulis tiandongensis]|uniref:MerR family transcriptional regulator n=1 Tax=Asticcacaulis tiandongensis TaxID=2565365 RepID=UPI00112E6BA5|nr:MerR family transcriptional regulator [Asticcacaulis tiandongensis]